MLILGTISYTKTSDAIRLEVHGHPSNEEAISPISHLRTTYHASRNQLLNFTPVPRLDRFASLRAAIVLMRFFENQEPIL